MKRETSESETERIDAIHFAAEEYIKRGYPDLAMATLYFFGGYSYERRLEWLLLCYDEMPEADARELAANWRVRGSGEGTGNAA